jgi:hypothetical protein
MFFPGQRGCGGRLSVFKAALWLKGLLEAQTWQGHRAKGGNH